MSGVSRRFSLSSRGTREERAGERRIVFLDAPSLRLFPRSCLAGRERNTHPINRRLLGGAGEIFYKVRPNSVEIGITHPPNSVIAEPDFLLYTSESYEHHIDNSDNAYSGPDGDSIG